MTAQQKFGTASLATVVAGANSANSGDWNFGNGQFTVEAWVRPTSTPSGLRAIMAHWANASPIEWWFGWNGNALILYYSTDGSNALGPISGAYTPTINVWVHVAVDRDASNTVRIYAGGTVLVTTTVAAAFYSTTGTNLYIGDDGSVGRAFAGQIDDLRITKGVARYAGAFTPPIAPFPDS
jgi:hypothetical protein